MEPLETAESRVDQEIPETPETPEIQELEAEGEEVVAVEITT